LLHVARNDIFFFSFFRVFRVFRGHTSLKQTFLGKKISGDFTIPSGIITTQISTIKKIAHEIPEVGVITTKSIGLHPREGNREPIFTQYAPGCFLNAVGLTNPGAEEFARQLQTLDIPADRFLLTSIFGRDAEEFVKVATLIAPYSDGLELNLSCPHASGYGMAIGQDPQLIREITAAVKQAVDIPIIPKLTPNVSNIVSIAKAAVERGADALCAINTVGPGYYTVAGHPVLTNKYGGISGKGILPIGLKCIQEISEAVDVPIIGCGGISSAEDVKAYQQAGASIIGIGSALIGLSSEELKTYFHILHKDVEQGTHFAGSLLKRVDMNFRRYWIVENTRLADDLSLLVFDQNIRIQPGQFVFAWLPGIGEKPFSVLDDQPLTLTIQQRGWFTEKLCQLKKGDVVYVRGPYGIPVEIPDQTKTLLVCGGCGLAAVYQIARDMKNTDLFIGARDSQHVFYLEKAQEVADIHIATEDGSAGYHGLVTELLQQRLQERQTEKNLVFFNCGPEAMIDAAVAIEKHYTSPDKIYHSRDYVTKCGVGICGSCATKDGRRLCVDGPFMN
jgi:dihydroorotate dehydrogenase subfamily 1